MKTKDLFLSIQRFRVENCIIYTTRYSTPKETAKAAEAEADEFNHTAAELQKINFSSHTSDDILTKG